MSRFFLLVIISLIFNGCATNKNSLSKDERFGQIYYLAGTKALSQGKTAEALRSLRKAVRYLPKNYEAWSNLGLALLQKQKLSLAEEALQKALNIAPSYSTAKNNLALVYIKQRKFKEALALFNEVRKDLEYERQDRILFNMALAYITQEQWVKAEQALKLALAENDNFCPAWLNLGLVRRKQGRLEPAIEALQKGSSGLCYGYVSTHYELGITYLDSSNFLKAENQFRSLIKKYPNTQWAEKSKEQMKHITKLRR